MSDKEKSEECTENSESPENKSGKNASSGKNKIISSLTYVSLLILGITAGLLGAVLLSGDNFFQKTEVADYKDEGSEHVDFSSASNRVEENVLLTMSGSAVVAREADTVVVGGSIVAKGSSAASAMEKTDTAYALVQAYLDSKHQVSAQVTNITVTSVAEIAPESVVSADGSGVITVPAEEVEIDGEESSSAAGDGLAGTAAAESTDYSARQDFSIEVPQEGARDLVNGLLSSSSLVEVNYISQKIGDMSTMQSEALELATRDAEYKAFKYAEMLDMDIVGVSSVTENPKQVADPLTFTETTSRTYTPRTLEVSYTVEIVFVARKKADF